MDTPPQNPRECRPKKGRIQKEAIVFLGDLSPACPPFECEKRCLFGVIFSVEENSRTRKTGTILRDKYCDGERTMEPKAIQAPETVE